MLLGCSVPLNFNDLLVVSGQPLLFEILSEPLVIVAMRVASIYSFSLWPLLSRRGLSSVGPISFDSWAVRPPV